MRIGIIAEGFADANVIKAIVKKILGCDSSEIRVIRPEEARDETDLKAMNYSNWGLVFESCQDESFLGAFLDDLEGEAIIVIHVDTAERGNLGYDVTAPTRTSRVDFVEYSITLRENVISKVESLIPETYRNRVVYAIAIEETDAWIIPLFENRKGDTASHVNAKETLQDLIGVDKKRKRAFTDTSHNSLDYVKLGKELARSLSICRARNKSLDLFCLDIEQHCLV